MAQPEFRTPEFIEGSSADEIHERMMRRLPPDLDDMPGGFPWDFTRPAAEEKDELINFHLVRAIMIAFPEYAWDEWLDLHGRQVRVERHPPEKASGVIQIQGTPGTEIPSGTVFCTPATDTGPSIEFSSLYDATIGENGTIEIEIEACEPGIQSNVPAGTIVLMAKSNKHITSVLNLDQITGGAERESDGDFYDRISAEYQNSMTYLGNDADYIRWAKAAGAGDCIVVDAAEGPGTVKLVLVDANGQPANKKLTEDVYNYIISPKDRTQRLLPTACSKLICESAKTVNIDYKITGLVYDKTTDIDQIKVDFREQVKKIYEKSKTEGVLRYNDIRPLISGIMGVRDFSGFYVAGKMDNIQIKKEEYPRTGNLDFG